MIPRWLEYALVALGLFLLFAISAPWIHELGVEYDEAHFYPTALKIAYGAEEFLPLPYGVTIANRPIPFLTMPYVGVLDALVYAIPYRLFGPSPLVPRYTNLALAALTFFLSWRFARLHGGRWAGLFVIALLLADLELLLHLPTNYGPLVLQQLFTMAALLALSAWWDSQKKRYFFLAVALLSLAFHEKLTFLWILSSLAAAALITHRREIQSAYRWWQIPAGLTLAVIILSPILYYTWHLPEIVLGYGRQNSGLRMSFAQLLAERWQSLDLMLRGVWMMEFTAGPVPESLRRGPALLALFLASFLVPHRGAQLCSLTAFGVWLWNLAFPDAGRMHHVLLLAPLWQVALAIGFGHANRWLRAAALGSLLWAAYDTTRCLAWYASRTAATGGANHWPDMTALAAEWLKENPPLHAVTLNWGVSRPVFTYSGGRIEVEEHFFETLSEFNPETTDLLTRLLQRRRTVWLVSDVTPLYAEQFARLNRLAASLNLSPRPVAIFPSRDDRFHLRAYRFDPPDEPLPLIFPKPLTSGLTLPIPANLDAFRFSTTIRSAKEGHHLTVDWLNAAGQVLFTDQRPLAWLPLFPSPHRFDFAPDLWPPSFTRRKIASGVPTQVRFSYELGGTNPSLEVVLASSDEPRPFPPSQDPRIGEYGSPEKKFYFTERAGQAVILTPERKLLPAAAFNLSLHRRLPAPNRNFRIQLERPLAELRATADTATPPAQPAGLLAANLVNLASLAQDLRFDIRYATSNNFMGAPLYSQAAAYLQRPAAEALLRVHRKLAADGFGLLIHDAYRPWRVTKMFWDATPASQRNFVANPATGSRHNRGCAVDLSLYDRKTGQPVEMPSGFDEFSPRAFPDYPGGTSHQRWLRGLLRTRMEAEGFSVNEDEWWHFDYRDWRRYPVLNLSFEQLAAR
jgi:D-alanyl-D-alanine dipeptidase